MKLTIHVIYESKICAKVVLVLKKRRHSKYKRTKKIYKKRADPICKFPIRKLSATKNRAIIALVVNVFERTEKMS